MFIVIGQMRSQPTLFLRQTTVLSWLIQCLCLTAKQQTTSLSSLVVGTKYLVILKCSLEDARLKFQDEVKKICRLLRRRRNAVKDTGYDRHCLTCLLSGQMSTNRAKCFTACSYKGQEETRLRKSESTPYPVTNRNVQITLLLILTNILFSLRKVHIKIKNRKPAPKVTVNVFIIQCIFFSSFSLAKSPPRDLQIMFCSCVLPAKCVSCKRYFAHA